MTDLEQNKKINQLKKQLTAAVQRIKNLELDLEPQGRLNEAFLALEKHIDTRLDKMDDRFAKMESRLDRMDSRFDRLEARFDRLENQYNHLQAKLEVMLDFITGINDLPEE